MSCLKLVPTKIESFFAQNSILPYFIFLFVHLLDDCSCKVHNNFSSPPSPSDIPAHSWLNLVPFPVSRWKRFKRDGKFVIDCTWKWREEVGSVCLRRSGLSSFLIPHPKCVGGKK